MRALGRWPCLWSLDRGRDQLPEFDRRRLRRQWVLNPLGRLRRLKWLRCRLNRHSLLGYAVGRELKLHFFGRAWIPWLCAIDKI